MFCLDKIHRTLKSNDFWRNVSNNGVRLEQAIGYEILERDVDFWDEQNAEDYRRNNYIKKIKLDQCLESQCSYFTSPTEYDDYSCNCGFPVSQKPKSAVKNDRVNKTTACCSQHHQCIAALANCTGIPAMKNYIKIDKNLYNHEKDQPRMNIKCLREQNDYCQQALCLCDSALTSCWSKIPPIPSGSGCFSCYLDDALLFAEGPITDVIKVRQQYIPLELETTLLLLDAYDGKEVPTANETIILAVMNVNNGLSAVRRSEKEMEQIIHTTRILIDNDVDKYEELSTDVNNDLEIRALRSTNEYRTVMLRIAPYLYINEQFKAYHASKRLLNETKELEKIFTTKAKEKLKNT
uniref:Phospholipase A2 domain-containing protein n=1 Tax=Meloidogyne incognita TaxID=6306 RepID=A0A914M216_MELIC